MFGNPVRVATADSVFEAVVELEEVEELDVVDEDDVDDVAEVVLLLVEDVMLEDLVMLELCNVMIPVGIDIVDIEVGMDMEETTDVGIVLEVGIIAGKIVVPRLNVVRISCVVGAKVPGTDAGAVH